MVQWLRCHTSTVGDMSSIPGWATKIAHVTWPRKKKKTEEKCESSVDRTTVLRQYDIPNFHDKLIFF